MKSIIKFPQIIFISIILLSALMAVYFYSFCRPFWLDECFLALNIVGKSNYFTLLSYNQASPPIFMYLSKLMYYIPIKAEFSLRIIPLLSFLASLAVFFALINKVLENNISKFAALSIFAFEYRVLYYAEEFKQYSTEMFIFLLIITSYFYIDIKNLKTKYKVLYGLFLGFLLWCSNAAAVAIAAIGIVYLIKIIKKECSIKDYLIIFLPSLISIIGYYFVMYDTIHHEGLHSFWQDAFISSNYFNFLKLMNRNAKYFFSGNYVVSAFIVMSGLLKCLFRNKFFVTIPIAILVLLSILKIYPFTDRLILFIFPLIAIAIAELCDFNKNIINWISLAIIALFVIIPNFAYSFESICFKKYYHEDIVTPLKYAKDLMKNNEKLIIDNNNLGSFNYYNLAYKFEPANVINVSGDIDEFMREIKKLPKGRYYYVYSHSNKRKLWVKSVHIFIKTFKDYKIFSDKHGNSLFIFTIS